MRLASFIASTAGGILVLCSISDVAAQTGSRSGWYVGGGIGSNWASDMDQEGWNRETTCYPTDACFDADPVPAIPGYRWRYDTSLHLAARFNSNPAVIKALFKASADAHAVLKWSPLHEAAVSNENPAVVETLLKAGAKLMARDGDRDTPLHLAARFNSNPAVFVALLKAGADPLARDFWNYTPVHYAAKHNENPAVIMTLLKAGADLKARDKDQETPLHFAARSNSNPAVIEALLKAGADLAAQDKKGRPQPLSGDPDRGDAGPAQDPLHRHQGGDRTKERQIEIQTVIRGTQEALGTRYRSHS